MRTRDLFPGCVVSWVAGAFGVPLALVAATPGGTGGGEMEVVVTVGAPSHRLRAEVFGQFLEVPNWGGENGVDAAWDDGEGAVRADVVERLRSLRAPSVRFPGGTAIDYQDWTRFIDGAPGRAAGASRPVLNAGTPGELRHHVGYDEFLELAEGLGWDPVLPVNLLDAVAQRKPMEAAAEHAAALVAYVNAPVGADLPGDLERWAELRAANGRREPWRVRVWQLGNEWFAGFAGDVRKALGTTDPEVLARRYRECVLAYVAAMRAVDPEIEFIVDAEMHDGIEPLVLGDPEVRAAVRYATIHRYAPWAVRRLTRGGEPAVAAEAGVEELWRTFAAMPGLPDGNGQATWQPGKRGEAAAALGYELACTEWNWNGWWALEGGAQRPDFDLLPAAGIGAAGYLNGLMRDGRVAFAHQSMTVGRTWGITAIRVDRGQQPRYLPQAAGQLLSARWHGTDVLVTTVEGAPMAPRPLGVNGGAVPTEPWAAVDVVATADERAVYLHVVNREPWTAARLRYAGPAVRRDGAVRRTWQAPEPGRPMDGDVEIEEVAVPAAEVPGGMVVPARSVSVIELRR